MRTPFMRKRVRGASLSTVVPSALSAEYSSELASIAAQIIYRSPLRSADGLPVYILNSAAFPDSNEVSYDRLLPYVLARLPEEDELLGGKGYEVIFFAGGTEERGDLNKKKKNRPSVTWVLQAYNVLGRAMRKRLAKLYLVHERKWVRLVTEVFSTIVSPKFRRKVEHVSTLSQLALHVPIQDLLIPPSAYALDRRLEAQIYVPYATGTRAFRATNPLPTAKDGSVRLPRVLREATSFVLLHGNVESEGLFRVNARATTLDILKEAYDRGQKFIVWREGDVVMNFPQWQEGFGDVTVHDVDEVDGYPVFAAAGLIKSWYSELKNPIFPESSYQYLERDYGGADPVLSHDKLMDLVGSESEWSQISKTNRQILRMHLIPLLSVIGQYPQNKMTPRALSMCFAPSLLRGSDPIRDALMCGIVSRIIEYAIMEWTNGLCERCGLIKTDFRKLLEFPATPEDREDPLDNIATARQRQHSISESNDNQSQGILLVDHESSMSSEEEEFYDFESVDVSRPPLPPRGNSGEEISHGVPQDNPPRYSTIITSQRPHSPPESAQPRVQTTNVVSRKPTPAQSRAATNESIRRVTETIPEDLQINSISLDSGHDFNRTYPNTNGTSALSADYTESPVSLTQTHEHDFRTHLRSGSVVSTASTQAISRKPLPGH